MLGPKLLAKQYPKLFKNDDYIIVNGEKCQLDVADQLGNNAPIGLLWVRRRKNITDPELDAKREAIGVISIFDGTFYPITSVDNLIPCVPDKAAVARLYYEYFPEESENSVINFIKFIKKSIELRVFSLYSKYKSRGKQNG